MITMMTVLDCLERIVLQITANPENAQPLDSVSTDRFVLRTGQDCVYVSRMYVVASLNQLYMVF